MTDTQLFVHRTLLFYGRYVRRSDDISGTLELSHVILLMKPSKVGQLIYTMTPLHHSKGRFV
jgi:hypothetical protein